LNKRRIADYAVQFIGYSARIIAREGNIDYASLDFVSGTAALFANEGFLVVPKRAALSSAVADLPLCIDELKSLVESDTPAAPVRERWAAGVMAGRKINYLEHGGR